MIIYDFYLEILNRLKNANIGIEYIDLWNNQIEKNQDEEDNLHFNYPAVFIDIHPVDFISLGRRKQAAMVNFDIIVAAEIVEETSSIESEDERSKAFEHLNLLDEVFKLLHGYNKAFNSGNSFGSISRRGVNFEFEDSDMINSNVIPFKSRMVDVSAMKKTVKKSSNVVMNGTVKLP